MSRSVLKKKHKKNDWKKYQSDTHTSKRIKLGILSLVILVMVIVIGKALSFVHSLSQPFAPDSSYTKINTYHWDGSKTINLVIKSDQLYVLSLNPIEKALTLLKIPDETYLNVPYGFGSWPARSVYGLGQAEEPAVGAYLLKETISYSFGVPIDGYILPQDDYSTVPFDTLISDLGSDFTKRYLILRDIHTDLSFGELFNLINTLAGIRFDKVKVVDLGQSQITDWKVLADGSRVLTADRAKLDLFISQNFSDSQIQTESLTVGIFNATDHPGLADRASRMVVNMGGRVIFTANTKERFAHNIVIGKESYTTARLAEILSNGCKLTPSSDSQGKVSFSSDTPCATIESNEVSSSRADITVYLGEEYFAIHNREGLSQNTSTAETK